MGDDARVPWNAMGPDVPFCPPPNFRKDRPDSSRAFTRSPLLTPYKVGVLVCARIAGVKISKLSLRNYGPDIAAPVLRMWHARGSKVPCRSREDCTTIEGSGARDMWATRSGEKIMSDESVRPSAVPKTIGRNLHQCVPPRYTARK